MSRAMASPRKRRLSESEGNDQRNSACVRWRCPNCAYLNISSCSHCHACRYERLRQQEPQPQPGIDKLRATGSRSSTERSEPVQVVVHAHNAGPAKGRPEGAEEAVVLGWSCSRCTYNNNGDRLNCEICFMPLSHSPVTAGEVVVEVDDLSHVGVGDLAHVDVDDHATVYIDDHATAGVDNLAHVDVDDHATVYIDDHATVYIDDHATACVDNLAHVDVDDHAAVYVDDLATVDVNNFAHQRVGGRNPLSPPAKLPRYEPSVQAYMWGCMVCTFNNVMASLECAACGGRRHFQHDVANEDLAVVSVQPKPVTVSMQQGPRTSELHIKPLTTEDLSLNASEGLKCRSDDEPDVVVVTGQTEPCRDDLIRLVNNTAPFQCVICLSDCCIGAGVVLQECLHEFCRSCLRDYIIHSTDPVIKCPYVGETYSCEEQILDREVKALAPDHYEKYLQRGLAAAEALEPNSFHCTTPNCAGWCIYEDDVNFFNCTLCSHLNCLTCKVIHEGQNCKEYQDDLKIRAVNDVSARKTQAYIDKLLKQNKAMKCPCCQVVLQKMGGCDGMRCSVCNTEICWATKMARWGPQGKFDMSGGCQCSVTKRCHPKCKGCH